MELHKILDKGFADKPLAETLNAPISALKGVTDEDAKYLEKSLNIRTIRDMATNKFFLNAQEIYKESEAVLHS